MACTIRTCVLSAVFSFGGKKFKYSPDCVYYSFVSFRLVSSFLFFSFLFMLLMLMCVRAHIFIRAIKSLSHTLTQLVSQSVSQPESEYFISNQANNTHNNCFHRCFVMLCLIVCLFVVFLLLSFSFISFAQFADAEQTSAKLSKDKMKRAQEHEENMVEIRPFLSFVCVFLFIPVLYLLFAGVQA